MAEREGEVEFTFFDKPRRLKFGFDEYLELESRSGRPPMEFVGNLMKLSPTDLRLALWVGLKGEDRKTVTLEWVGKNLQRIQKQGKGFLHLIKALDAAFTASGYFASDTPDGEEGDEDRPRPAGLVAVSSASPTPIHTSE